MPELTIPAGTLIQTVELAHESSAKVIVADTALGSFYIKGPPATDGNAMLLREWVGTKLADAFGLQTLSYGLMAEPLAEGDPEIALSDGNNLRRDIVFATKAEEGAAWEGGPEQLRIVGNPSAFGRLVVFDTWVRNRDRFFMRPDGRRHENMSNVFISADVNRSRSPTLLAIDHTHILGSDAVIDCGAASEAVSDEAVYGNFPSFETLVTECDVAGALGTLHELSYQDVLNLVAETPAEWGMTIQRAHRLARFLVARAQFLFTGGPGRFL